MTTAKTLGLTVGMLMLAQGIGAAVTNFVLLQPAIAPPGFLVNAHAHALAVAASALLGIVIGSLALAIAITVLPVVRKLSERLALSLVALGAVALSAAVVEHANVMSLLSLSQAYAASTDADPAAFAGLRGVVAASRNWAHLSHILIDGATLATFYTVLYRFAVVPRALAALGLFAVALQLTTISLPFFGGYVIFPLLAPLGFVTLAVAIWLMVKGFANNPA